MHTFSVLTELAPGVSVKAAEMISRGWLFLVLSFQFYPEHKGLFYFHSPPVAPSSFSSPRPACVTWCRVSGGKEVPHSGREVLPKAHLPQLLVQPRGAEGSARGSRALPMLPASVSGESSRLWGRPPGWKLWILETKRAGNAANPRPEGELTVLSLLKGVRWDPELSLGPLQALSPVPVLEC